MNNVIFTIIHNEQYFLPIWLKYYSQFFENIYVLDHITTDGSVEKLSQQYKFTTIKVDYDKTFDAGFLKDRVINEQKELLKKYSTVVFAEADEFVVPDPDKYKDLSDYIDKMSTNMARCNGYEIIQQDGEKDIDLNLPILDQRKYWVPNEPMCKTLISKVPLRWGLGFHGVEDGNPEVDKDLYLLHLKRMDWKMFEKRWRETGLELNPTFYHEHFHQHDTKLKHMETGVNLIPERFKHLL